MHCIVTDYPHYDLWCNFMVMLSEEDQVALGISKDRNMHQNIVRLLTAYNDLKEKVKKNVDSKEG